MSNTIQILNFLFCLYINIKFNLKIIYYTTINNIKNSKIKNILSFLFFFFVYVYTSKLYFILFCLFLPIYLCFNLFFLYSVFYFNDGGFYIINNF